MNGLDNNRFGGGDAGTTLHPAIALATILVCILILVLRRKYMMIPFLVLVIFTPIGQQVYVAGLHLFTDRIVILLGCLRMAFTKKAGEERIPGGLNEIDKMYMACVTFAVIATLLLFREMGATINQLGAVWDAFGGYFLIRFMIQDEEDVARFIKTLAVCISAMAVTMMSETFLHQNVFGIITGDYSITIRDGAIRAHGPFYGPIIAGTFAATALCLCLWLWKSGKSRPIALMGIIGCTVATFLSQSSTPLSAYTGALVALLFWVLRKQMRLVRWGIVILLISLHMVMKAPVWFLIDHISLFSGNSGFHRAVIIDGLVHHFGEWWLMGVKSTKYWGWDMWDQANQFVGEGENGGLAALTCFILLISRAFARLGTARKLINGDKQMEWKLYLLGATLFSYVVSFFGTSFDRGPEIYPWYALFAMIAVMTTPILRAGQVTDSKVIEPRPSFGFAPATPALSTRDRIASYTPYAASAHK